MTIIIKWKDYPVNTETENGLVKIDVQFVSKPAAFRRAMRLLPSGFQGVSLFRSLLISLFL